MSTSSFTPRYVLQQMLERGDEEMRAAAAATLTHSSHATGANAVLQAVNFPPRMGFREVFVLDCHGRFTTEDAELLPPAPPTSRNDVVSLKAYRALRLCIGFLKDIWLTNSIDGLGGSIRSYIRYGSRYCDAAWDGRAIAIGDGDGALFTDFSSIEVIAHEVAHGFTQFNRPLSHFGQAGALSESLADVFATLVKQWANDESVETADWLIGGSVLSSQSGAAALRSLSAPGTAYREHAIIGNDPQPSNMGDFAVDVGEHLIPNVNSGIPSNAFYRVAMELGGRSWEAAGRIWQTAWKKIPRNADFQYFADLTQAVAAKEFGWGSKESIAVANGWKGVGIRADGTRVALEKEVAPRSTIATSFATDEDSPWVQLSAVADALWRMAGRQAQEAADREFHSTALHDQTDSRWIVDLSREKGTGIFLTPNITSESGPQTTKSFMSHLTYDDCVARGLHAISFKWVPESIATAEALRDHKCGNRCTHTCVKPGCMCSGGKCQ